MADAQLPHHDKAALLQGDAEFQQLVSAHHALDEQLRRLSTHSFPSPDLQFTEAALKKKKLALKDRIEAMVREQSQAEDSA
jgi:uncharacterized protein YdcH (DUF465 family)